MPAHLTIVAPARLGPSTPTITSPANSTNARFVAPITFDAPVAGFDASDPTIGYGAASGFAGSGTSHSAPIAPVADVNVTEDISAEAAINGAALTLIWLFIGADPLR